MRGRAEVGALRRRILLNSGRPAARSDDSRPSRVPDRPASRVVTARLASLSIATGFPAVIVATSVLRPMSRKRSGLDARSNEANRRREDGASEGHRQATHDGGQPAGGSSCGIRHGITGPVTASAPTVPRRDCRDPNAGDSLQYVGHNVTFADPWRGTHAGAKGTNKARTVPITRER